MMLVRLVSLLAIAYACTLIVATHLPPSNSVVVAASRAPDKLWHLVAYALLAIFFYSTDVAVRPRASKRLLPLLGFLLAFAVFDEITQPLFGRNTEFMDLVFDFFGAACGLAIARSLQGLAQRLIFQNNYGSSDS